MRDRRLLVYRLVCVLIAFGIGMAIKAIWPGLGKNQMLLVGVPVLFVLIVLVPMRFKALRAPKAR